MPFNTRLTQPKRNLETRNQPTMLFKSSFPRNQSTTHFKPPSIRTTSPFSEQLSAGGSPLHVAGLFEDVHPSCSVQLWSQALQFSADCPRNFLGIYLFKYTPFCSFSFRFPMCSLLRNWGPFLFANLTAPTLLKSCIPIRVGIPFLP